MSFNLNPLNNINNQPVIKQSQKTKDGGAGNTGYFQQEKKEKDDEKDQDTFDKSIFNENEPEEDFLEDDNFLAKKIFEKFKKLFSK